MNDPMLTPPIRSMGNKDEYNVEKVIYSQASANVMSVAGEKSP